MKILETESVSSALIRHTSGVKKAELRLINAEKHLREDDVSLEAVQEHREAIGEHIDARCDNIPQQRWLQIGSLRIHFPPRYLAKG
jgi:hypothetical protein